MAREARADVDPGELIAMHGEDRHLLVGEREFDRHALVDFVCHDDPMDVRQFIAMEQADVGERGQRRIERLGVADLLTDEFDLEGRLIFREHDTMPVQDQASARRDRIGANAVAQRQVRVIIVPEHLKIEEPTGHDEQQHAGDDPRDDAANREQAVFRPVILDSITAHSHHRCRNIAV